jgi:hypothetical protein
LLLGWVAELAQVELDPVAMDGHDDACAFGAGGHQVVVQGGQQHVIAVFQSRHHTLSDAKLAGDFYLGHLRGLADHREVHGVDPVHLLRVGMGGGDVSGKLWVG